MQKEMILILLIKEKFFTELKIRNHLKEKSNHINLKKTLHVDIRGVLNSDLYLAMKKVKAKEFNILYKVFYEHKNSPQYKALLAKKNALENYKKKTDEIISFLCIKLSFSFLLK